MWTLLHLCDTVLWVVCGGCGTVRATVSPRNRGDLESATTRTGGGGHNRCISVGVTGPCSAQRELSPFPNPTDPLMTTVCDLGSFADCANNEIEETGGKVTPVRAHYPTQKKPYSRRYVRERVGIFDVGSTLSRTYLNQRSSDFTSSVE